MRRVALSLAALVVCLCAAGAAQAAITPTLKIKVLSNRADLISGGDALVEIRPNVKTDMRTVKVDVDGRDVTDAFLLRSDGRLVGRVEGLALGPNVLTAKRPDGHGARITITNHPIGGPVFSGPQILPWTCFAGSIDPQCNRQVEYTWSYKSTDPTVPGLLPYDPASPPPGDVALTTTDQGKVVPYIVRQETGTIDRDQYRIAVLYNPALPWSPAQPQDGFNGKALATHGASCNTEYQQANAPDVLNETALSRGFAVFSHALNNAGHNCNVVLMGEAMTMTKERLIDTYGELRYTIGIGTSGGALAQYQTANAYPGIYQGIIPGASFPDTWSGRMLYEDYSLLRRYYENPTSWDVGVAWTPVEMTAVMGHPNYVNSIVYNTAISALLDPSRSCPGVPAENVYSATNRTGLRCSLQDYMVNIFGRRSQDGFAGRPWDTTGVEYGRKALIAGKITAAQFADVNFKVGGRDIDYEPQTARAVADRPALYRAYRSGAVNQATNLNQVAIIDLRGPDPGAFHDVYRAYALRARLEREHGTAANQLLWRGAVPPGGDEAIVAMDKWLAAVEADKRSVPLAQKILEDRPADVADRCSNGGGVELPPEFCNAVVQSYTTARIEAGMQFTDDVIKCNLKPLRRSDYFPILFSDAHWAKLEAAFPTGVCDYSQWGVDRTPTVGWLTYKDGPGGVKLPAPPTYSAF